MKKKYIILSAVLVGMGLGLSSCADQLDADRYFKDRMSLEDVFSSRDYSEESLIVLHNKFQVQELQVHK